jgi:uncharacterized protein (TIGR03437 family)
MIRYVLYPGSEETLMNKLLLVCFSGLITLPILLAQTPTYDLYNLSLPGTADANGLAAVVAADFNSDHKTDLAVVGQNGSAPNILTVYLGNGDGTFQQPTNYTVGQFAYAMISGDFNGDGKVDLVTANADSQDISVLLGNGDGTFQAPVSYPVGGAPGGLIAVDLNGDGKLDIAVANQKPASLSILLGNGDGSFSAPSVQSFGTALLGVAAADFNGDGKPDLVVSDNNTVWLLLGNGDGTVGSPQALSVTGDLVGITQGDFNADKKADLAVTSAGSPGGVYVLLGNGDATFQSPTLIPAGLGAFAVIAADFNSDGKLDLAVANNFEVPLQNDVSLLLGNGDGTFASEISLAAGNNPFGLTSGDFNGDGKLDLAVANNGSPYVSLLFSGFPKGLSSFTTVSAADGSPGLAPEALVSAYAPGISAFQQGAVSPISTTLVGLTINVQDSAGVTRPSYFLFAGLDQLNYQIPADTLPGPATITVLNGTAAAMIETVTISPVAPSIFTIDSSGTGIAAATALSVNNATSVQTPVSVFQCTPYRCAGVPIVLSASAPVFVVLYGTGIRGAGAASNVTCTINGVGVPVQYAGPQNEFLGLDQVNISLPLSLMGSGQSQVTLTAAGLTSNSVLLDIQ